MYIKEFEIRWSDIDANKHLGNSTYIDYMSNLRMAFFLEQGIGLEFMNDLGIGPIVLYEHIYYFREVLIGQPVRVSLEMEGHTEDCMFVKFIHNFYDTSGKNLAHSEMLFSWLDLNTRKLAKLPTDIAKKVKQFPKSEDFKILTKEETRKYGKRPLDLV